MGAHPRRLNPLCELVHGGSDSARQDAERNTEEIDCCMWAVSRVPTSEEDVTLEVEGWQNTNHKLSLNRKNQVIRYRNRKDSFLSGIHCNFYMHIKQFNLSLLCSGLKKLCTEGQKNCMNLPLAEKLWRFMWCHVERFMSHTCEQDVNLQRLTVLTSSRCVGWIISTEEKS